jgi:class 3 adenylate cyclase
VTDRETLLVAARAASTAGRWLDAYTAFTKAGQLSLSADDLELLASAATFSSRPDEASAARQRAFSLVRAEQPRRAAQLAILSSISHFTRNSIAVGIGWAQQAKDLLDDQGECEEAVTYSLLEAVVASETGRHEEALEAVEDVIVRARRLGAADDAKAMATLLKGQILMMRGRVEEGAPLVDSAMALAVSGCLHELASAYIFCGTISTCASSGDLERAWEWTNEVGRCSVRGIADYPGDCRLHRAEMLRIRGEWAKAEVELASVCEELGTWDVGHSGIAYYELGEVSLRRGDFEAAAKAFAKCKELGRTALPGLASLELVKGNPETAMTLLDEGMTTTSDVFDRARLLHVLVGARLAAGRIDEADAAATELGAMAEHWKLPIHEARAATSLGLVAAAKGDRGVALHQLRTAVERWRQVPAPYDEAGSRVALAEVEGSAARVVQLESALQLFGRLGATIDVAKVLDLLGRAQSAERTAVTMMFTDIEGSTVRLASMGDEAWLAVLRRHDAILRSMFDSYDGELFVGTGDGFFVGFRDVDNALSCAIAIQGALDEVRVRIGIHFAEVSRDAGGLSGRGVHETARISALAAGGEVIVSTSTLARATGTLLTQAARKVELKGLPGKMEIAILQLGDRYVVAPT